MRSRATRADWIDGKRKRKKEKSTWKLSLKGGTHTKSPARPVPSPPGWPFDRWATLAGSSMPPSPCLSGGRPLPPHPSTVLTAGRERTLISCYDTPVTAAYKSSPSPRLHFGNNTPLQRHAPLRRRYIFIAFALNSTSCRPCTHFWPCVCSPARLARWNLFLNSLDSPHASIW